MNLVLWCRLLRAICWFAMPRLSRLSKSHVRNLQARSRTSLQRDPIIVVVALIWPIRSLPWLFDLIRRGWYRCDRCGRLWNTQATGGSYVQEFRHGRPRTTGYCGPCKAAELKQGIGENGEKQTKSTKREPSADRLD